MTPRAKGFDWRAAVEARQRLTGVARRTPLVAASDLIDGSTLHLKAECLQLTHAFKFRGAYNRTSLLTDGERQAGLIAASSGNHAMGLSLAGSLLGARVTVVMPESAPMVKELGCRRYGAEVLRHGQAYDDALAYAKALAARQGMTYVQSFDDPLVAAGQASVVWEILEDLPDVEVIVAPIGGGGLLSGIAGLLRTMPPDQAARFFPARRRPLADITIVGVQAAGAASTVASIRAGHRLELPSIETIADGIAVRQPGAWTFEVIREFADDYVTVTDDEMLRTMGSVALREKLIVEPAGAAAIAAVTGAKAGAKVDLGGALRCGRKIACVISGGNVEPMILAEALARATK